MVLNLSGITWVIALFGEDSHIKEGDTVKRTKRILRCQLVSCRGPRCHPLGMPIDGKGPIKSTATRKVEIKAPGIVARQSV